MPVQNLKFTAEKPFDLKKAREYEGWEVILRWVREKNDMDGPSGERVSYLGILRPLTRTTCFVGNNVVCNQKVVSISIPDEEFNNK